MANEICMFDVNGRLLIQVDEIKKEFGDHIKSLLEAKCTISILTTINFRKVNKADRYFLVQEFV